MKEQCVYKIYLETNEAGLKKIHKLAKKLNTTSEKLLTSVLSHGLTAMTDCLDTKDPFKYANPVYQAGIQKQEAPAAKEQPEKPSDTTDNDEPFKFDDFKF